MHTNAWKNKTSLTTFLMLNNHTTEHNDAISGIFYKICLRCFDYLRKTVLKRNANVEKGIL